MAASILLVLVATAARAAPPDFDRQIAPLLASRCLDCHSGAKPKGDLDLSRKGGVIGGVVVAGKPADSTLWERVAADEMPPKKPLTDGEKKLLREWIEGGAKWGTDPLNPFRFTTSTRAGYDWWALQPIRRPLVPESRNPQSAIRNDIDRFILAKLSEKGLSPSPPADRRTLIRRVYFDLIGLPPTPDEVAAFLKDDSPDAYEKVVDRLLASPQYGERWARHWLDVVRFGETDGFERNSTRPNAWHYRDWVIRALNADTPYDEFVRLQLAGDVLRPDDADSVKATGFLVAAVHNTVLGNDQMRAVARQDELEDLVGSVGQTFLGLTVNCARCHDHKFDPIAQADYYRLAAALGGVNHGERDVIDPTRKAELARLAAELDQVRKGLAAIEDPARKAALADRGKGRAGRIAPTPLAAWDFRVSPEDLKGKLHAKPIGGARLTPDGAVFDGKGAYLRTDPLPVELRAKTLEAWVRPDNLTQRAGGLMSVQTADGSVFDGIVFAERDPGRWFVGSDGFRRSRSFDPPSETQAKAVHVAVTYSDDGTIAGYREGKPALAGYVSEGPVTFKSAAVILFGCRHEPAGGDRMLAGTVVGARLYDRALSPDEVAASFAVGPGFVSESEIEAKLTPELRAKRRELSQKQAQLTTDLSRRRQAATGKAYAVVPQRNPGVTRLLLRGQVEAPANVVAPAGFPAITDLASDFGLAADAPDDLRRKKLAEWVTSPDNPLFARVIVNRIWHYHFGTGIVETPNDFGFNGGRPSHPELLDWLASELVARKYSLKSLHRLIVTSATYRQSPAPRKEAAAIDADNRLLWRKRPQRLEGEAVRDTMLAASGLLNREVGGKGFSDYKERNFNGTAYYDPFDPVGPQFHRRSIYRFVPRGGNQGLLDTFDCPDPAAAAPRRTVTTTPLQALALWNSGFALRMSEAFADRVAKDAPGGIGEQVTRAWQLAFQRDPTAEERKLADKLVADHGLKALCRALFNANEFVMVE